jgi:glycosyltransferase involved in cell wall biosynthesis
MSSLVSIIIPCYNAARYVGEAIESALVQTYDNKEVIVIDDGSTDGSLEVIRSFGDQIQWETGPNRGGSAARNRGMELARGELIQFLDADDLLHPDKIARQIPLTSGAKREVCICFGDVRPPEQFLARAYRRLHDTDDSVIFVIRGVMQTSAPLHIRSELEAISGFDEKLSCSQERDLHLRLVCRGVRFVQLREILFTVRRQVGSVSSDSMRVLRQHLDIARRALAILQERGEDSESRRRMLAGWLASDARTLTRNGDRKTAIRYFDAAREIHFRGGLDVAFSPVTLAVRRVLGSSITESLVACKRRLYS